MTAGFEKRLFLAWLILSAITIASLSLGPPDGQEALGANAVITFSVIAVALIKVRIIFREFMEVRHAPVSLRRLTDLWLLIAAVTLLGTYFVGMALRPDQRSSPTARDAGVSETSVPEYHGIPVIGSTSSLLVS